MNQLPPFKTWEFVKIQEIPMLGFGKVIPLSRFKEGAQDANKVFKASVEGNHRVP